MRNDFTVIPIVTNIRNIMDGAGVGESESKHGADVFIARQVTTLVHSIQVAGHRMGGHVGGGDGDDLVKLVEAKLCVEDGADGGEDQLVGGHPSSH